jgi:hypothetical protein
VIAKRYLPELLHLHRLMPVLLIAVIALCSSSAYGAVSLERTIRPEAGKSGFEVVSAMQVGKEGTLIAIDRCVHHGQIGTAERIQGVSVQCMEQATCT